MLKCMEKNSDSFIINQNDELKTLVKWVINRIEKAGYNLEDIVFYPEDKLINVLIEMKPSNIKMVTNFIYVLNLYSKHIGLDGITLDRKIVWKKYQESGKIESRFISKKEFEELVFNIEMFEELNANWYSAFIRSIYYGIYSDDMSVIKNLRGSNIDVMNGNVTLFNDNGEVYNITIPIDLAQDLIELSNTNTWERKNRYGIFLMNIEGDFYDSCFKLEKRNGDEEKNNYRFSYFSRLRKISKEYLERPLKPMNLYVSGIMHRISDELEKHGKNIEYAFIEHPRYSYPIIQDELNKSHYLKDAKYFRQMVIGHLNDFK